MSEIIETYQQEQEKLGKPELPQMALATVVSVNNDGLELIFDGEDEASTKHFPCNVGVSFEADQRVLMMKVNGSYVALCPVGWKGSGGGGGGGQISVASKQVTVRARNMPGTAIQQGTFSDTAPAGWYHMGAAGAYCNSGNLICDIGITSIQDTPGGTAQFSYHIANPNKSELFDINLYATMRYLKFS